VLATNDNNSSRLTYSNFHSSFSTLIKNCRIPSKVSSSLRTKIRTGSFMNLSVTSNTLAGSVALMSTTCVDAGK
jgi:hypothetical protein